ncbi:hypothetical protein SKAU_G00275320 [Synaphobranchus kaupii]|uniref:Ig-like domain-containing protein n=1 Tax=Synaphobranchus kaupii TaxID=118154 RepID=A0A9Q1INZ8_SYNKA|nr:hypothetical protein SKAU_G00275320 [Synaphobranchus kaupii]
MLSNRLTALMLVGLMARIPHSQSENNTCTFSPVSFAHRGEYWCVAGNDTALYSNPVNIRVSALPKTSLTVEPKWRPLYHGETVTLTCEVDPYSNWTYFWYTEQRHRATSLTKEYNVTISGAAGSDQGQYWCEGRLEGRNVTSQRSDSITLTAAALPKATVTVEPKWLPLYTGDWRDRHPEVWSGLLQQLEFFMIQRPAQEDSG